MSCDCRRFFAPSDHTCRHADNNRKVRHGFGYDGARPHDAVLADVGHHDCPVADPTVPADRDPRPLARLLANGNIEAFNAVLEGFLRELEKPA